VRVTIRPDGNRFVVDVKLAKPTELGRYGWILFGVDTDRNPFTGGGRGDERTRSFNFAVASLRQQADLAPGGGVARYPRRSSVTG
jgi:hypothetical protein